MHEETVGLHIDGRYITAAQARWSFGDKLKVQKVGWIEHPLGASPEDTIEAIRELWRRSGFSVCTVSASLRSRAAITKYFRHPFLTDTQLDSALRLEAEEALLESAGGICLDWHLNERTEPIAGREDGGCCEGFFIAARRAEVENEIRLLRAAHLFPVRLDVDSTAVAGLYLQLEGAIRDGETVCLLHITPSQADMVILSGARSIYPRCIYSRNHDWGDNFDYLLDSIREDLRYYQYKLRKRAVTRFAVTGKMPLCQELRQLVSDQFGIDAILWNPLGGRNVKRSRLVEKLPEMMGPMFAPALGLALQA